MSRILVIVALLSISLAPASIAQTYPSKPIRLIVPFSPGGGSDIHARILAPALSESLGQQVIIDNREGLAGSIGTALAARASPDGYTILLSYVGTMAINPWVYKNPGYHPVKQFTHITRTTTQPTLLVANLQVPVISLQELVAMGKAKPEFLTFAYAGASNQLGGKLFEMLTGARMTFVPYRGGGPAILALAGGHVDLMMASPAIFIPFLKAGKLRALAVLGPERLASIPHVLTSRESGFPDFEVMGWYGVAAPAGTPAEVIARLNAEIGRVLRLPEVADKHLSQSMQPQTNSAAEMAAYVRAEYDRWGKVAKTAGIQPE